MNPLKLLKPVKLLKLTNYLFAGRHKVSPYSGWDTVRGKDVVGRYAPFLWGAKRNRSFACDGLTFRLTKESRPKGG